MLFGVTQKIPNRGQKAELHISPIKKGTYWYPLL